MQQTTELYNEDIPHNTKATIKRLLALLAHQKSKLFIVSVAAFLSSAAYAFVPLIIGQALDNLLPLVTSSYPVDNLANQLFDALAMPTCWLIVAAIISSLLTYLQQYIIASVGENLTLTLRRAISAKLNRLPLRYFDTHQTGTIISLVNSDLDKVSSVMQISLMQFISAVFTILLTALMMFMLSPIMFLLVAVTVIISSGATIYVSGFSQRNYAKNMSLMGKLSAHIEEVYSGNRVIKSFAHETASIQTVAKINQQQFQATRTAQFVDYSIYPAIRLINQLGFVVIAIACSFMVISGRLTLGGAQAFLQYFNQASEPVTQAFYTINSLQAAIAGAERVFTMLDEQEEVPDSALSTSSITQGRVTFNNVKFGYTAERTLINDLNLEVRPNEMVAIVGPTGGGKTTLINLIMRFYELQAGSICIDGIDITTMPRAELRRNIGMVLQDTWLFEGTIAENIAYGKMEATRAEIVAAAKDACCDHFIRTMPDGYDTVISGENSQLSQGQIQLLTIARAMLANPAILILDEATSSVDTRTEIEIQKAMTRLMQDKTSFVIAHRLSTIRDADLILVVKDGDIIERGTHEHLLLQNGFYASLYHSQLAGVS